jgi:hypothetical protein
MTTDVPQPTVRPADRGAVTRAGLLAAAREVFISAGYAQAGVTEIDEAVAVVMTGALILAVAEVSLDEDAVHARRLAEGVLDVLCGVGPRVPGVTSRLR